ncbi:c-type cytochrome [uncultured Hymenobacter sp.]|uniref:c-type cytochrome n=1 Tax=uncultured Hymenobacter sp. TaxID=170016 RepID=UPI0035CB6993
MKRLLLSALILLGGLAACDSNPPPATASSAASAGAAAASAETVPTPPAATNPAATPATAVVAKVDGPAIYASNCQQCHQAAGTGLPGAFPPLRGSPVVNSADATQLTTIILHGYNARPEYGAMPGYAASLSDEQIAAVATYVRGAWSNTGKAVAATTVAKVRATTK